MKNKETGTILPDEHKKERKGKKEVGDASTRLFLHSSVQEQASKAPVLLVTPLTDCCAYARRVFEYGNRIGRATEQMSAASAVKK